HAWHDDGSYNTEHAEFLDNWTPSQGSAEKEPAPDPDRRPLDLMEKARAIVYGARQESYGHPADDYTRTAGMWSAFLGIPITPEQASLMMVLLKISRERNRPGDDNIVDAHGYLLCYGRIQARQRQVIEAHGHVGGDQERGREPDLLRLRASGCSGRRSLFPRRLPPRGHGSGKSGFST